MRISLVVCSIKVSFVFFLVSGRNLKKMKIHEITAVVVLMGLLGWDNDSHRDKVLINVTADFIAEVSRFKTRMFILNQNLA